MLGIMRQGHQSLLENAVLKAYELGFRHSRSLPMSLRFFVIVAGSGLVGITSLVPCLEIANVFLSYSDGNAPRSRLGAFSKCPTVSLERCARKTSARGKLKVAGTNRTFSTFHI